MGCLEWASFQIKVLTLGGTSSFHIIFQSIQGGLEESLLSIDERNNRSMRRFGPPNPIVTIRIIKFDFLQPIEINIRAQECFKGRKVLVPIAYKVNQGGGLRNLINIEEYGFFGKRNIMKPRGIPEIGQDGIAAIDFKIEPKLGASFGRCSSRAKK